MVSFIDAHCHLQDERARGDLRSLMARARDRLLIETDSPDIPPAGSTGLNEPSYLFLAAQTASEVLGVNLEDVAALATANATALFGSLAAPGPI
jgi:TatD DNase family protein